MLIFGIVEVGLAMNDELALAHTVRTGSRVASASGDDLYADYGILRSVARESTALKSDQIDFIVVYRANGFGDEPSDGCKAGNPSATGSTPCNVYTSDAFDVEKERWGCQAEESLDKYWCPTDRDVSLADGGTDFVGVWMKVRHPWLTKMFGGELTLTDQSVIRLEPLVKV